MVERVVRDVMQVIGDRKREVSLLLLRAALNPKTFYGSESDSCFYSRLDTAAETDLDELNRREILLFVAFYAEPKRGSRITTIASTEQAEWVALAVAGLTGFGPDEHPICDSDPEDGEPAELAYLHAVGTAAKFQLPFLVALLTTEKGQVDGPFNTELLWPAGTPLSPLVKKVQHEVHLGTILCD